MNKNKRAIMWLSGGHFVNDIYTGILNPIMPFIAAKIGITLAMATLVISISNIFSSLLQPIFGFFADNMLKRFFIFWGLILSSLFLPMAPVAQNFYMLILFVILGSIGSSFYHPQASGFVNNFATENNTCVKDMGFFSSAGSMGYSLGPLIAAFVVQYMGMNKMPVITIIGLICASTMFIFVPKLSTTTIPVEKKTFIKTFKHILLNRKMNYLMIISMMKVLISTSFAALLPFLWKDMGYSPFYIGIALFLFILTGAIGSLVSHKIESIVGAKKILFFSMTATLPMIILFALTYKTHPVLSMIMFVIIGFTTMLAHPVTLVMGQNLMPEYKSLVAGFMNGFAWGVVAIFLSLIGLTAQHYGIVNVLLILSVVPVLSTPLIKYL